MTKEEVKKVLVGLAAYYEKKLSDLQINMYAEDLSVLSRDELIYSVRRYRQNPRNIRFPLPASLISVARPESNPEHEAIESSARIWSAIAKYGYVNPERARAYIGELGWAAVEKSGGWRTVCEESSRGAVGTFKSQLRKLVEAIHSQNINRQLQPELPQSIEKVAELINLKSMPTNEVG